MTVFRCIFMAITVAATLPSWAQEAKSPEMQWRLALEARFMRPPVSREITLSKRAVIALCVVDELELRAMTKEEFEAAGTDWERVSQQATKNADALLAECTIRNVRNEAGVIEYAEVKSPQPIVSCAVLASTFLSQFAETLGETVLLAVPNRYVAFVFPKHAGKAEEYGPLVLDAYKATAWKVSPELFELSKTGIRAVGSFAD